MILNQVINNDNHKNQRSIFFTPFPEGSRPALHHILLPPLAFAM
jgi:hypothetical protein